MGSFDNAEYGQNGGNKGYDDGLNGARGDTWSKPVEPHGGNGGTTNITDTTNISDKNTNINKNTNVAGAASDSHSSSSASGGNSSIRMNTAFVTAPSFGGGECTKAKSGGAGAMGFGLSYGQSDIDEDCERRRAAQAMCGDGNAKTALALQALQLSASIPNQRVEHYAAQGIARDQAVKAMDVNDACFQNFGVEARHTQIAPPLEQPQQPQVAQPTDNPNYVTRDELNGKLDNFFRVTQKK